MRSFPRYAAAAAAAVVLATGGFATGQSVGAHPAPKVPTSCVAPLNNGTYKMVDDGDAERYTDGVYVCVKGRWVLDPDYGL